MKYKGIDFHQFPDLEVLSKMEEELRREKFGYRARYISKAAEDIFNATRETSKKAVDSFLDCDNARSRLLNIKGIGKKVADCICLIGLGYYDAVPIDTHILKYMKVLFGVEGKSLTCKVYKELQDKFKKIYGEYSGIAQLFIFRKIQTKG